MGNRRSMPMAVPIAPITGFPYEKQNVPGIQKTRAIGTAKADQ
jgi:hypothetical protein